MARLDRLIQVLHEQRADTLRLAVGKPASIVRDGSARPVTKEALTDAQIVSLVREIAPAEHAKRVGAGEVRFDYRGSGGGVEVEMTQGAGATLRRVEAAAGAAGAAGRVEP
ncbi:MAG: hypothetical protein ACREOC_15530, partial [Gemmatimonadales bacterium]